MMPAILTITYVIAICAIVWLGHRHELAVHAAEQRQRDGQPDRLRGVRKINVVQSHAVEVDHG
jgi:hypothetical protein